MPTAPAPGFAALGLRQPEDLKRMGANTAFVLNGYPGLALSRLRPNVRDGSKAERLTPSKCYPVCPHNGHLRSHRIDVQHLCPRDVVNVSRLLARFASNAGAVDEHIDRATTDMRGASQPPRIAAARSECRSNSRQSASGS